MKRMATKTLGRVPTAVGVYWHNPKVLMTSFGIGNKAQKWDGCDAQLKSFAHMAVASMIGCSWCLDLNYFQAHNEHLDQEKAREVPRWHESDVFAEACGLKPLTRAAGAASQAWPEDPVRTSRTRP